MIRFRRFFEIITEANSEKRIEFIRNKYGLNLKEKLSSYDFLGNSDSKIHEFFNSHGVKDFPSFIVMSVDPLKGPYSEWITRIILKKDFINKESFTRFMFEDYSKIKTDIEFYNKYKKFFKVLAKDENDPELTKYSDINNIKSDVQLYQLNKLLDKYTENEQQEKERSIKNQDVDKIYVSNNYIILSPKTEEASCKYGKGTRWCTAGDYNNRFEFYNSEGPLYIIIDRKNNKKYQFHFQSNQYMDSNDDPINVSDFINNHEEIKDIINDIAIKNNNLLFVSIYDLPFVAEKFPTLDEKSKNMVIKDNLKAAVFFIDKFPKDVNDNQDLIVIDDKGGVSLKFSINSIANFFPYRGNHDYITDEDFIDIFEGNIDLFLYDNLDYKPEMLELLDDVSIDAINTYIEDKYPDYDKKIVHPMDIQTFVEYTNDDHITYLVRQVYSDLFAINANAAFQEMILRKIKNKIYGDITVEDNYLIFTNIKPMFLKHFVEELETMSGDENGLIQCDDETVTNILGGYKDDHIFIHHKTIDSIDFDINKQDFNENFRDML